MTKLCAQTLCAKGKMKTLQSTIIPSNVGIIYSLSRLLFPQIYSPELLAWYIQYPQRPPTVWNVTNCLFTYQYVYQNVYFLSLRPKGAQKLSNLHSSPKRWHDISNNISNTNIYTPKTVGRIYPVQILYFKNVHSNCVSSNRVQQLSQSVCVGVTLFPLNYNHLPSVCMIYPIPTHIFPIKHNP